MRTPRAGIVVVLAGALTAAAAGSARAGAGASNAAYTLNLFSDVDGVNVYTHYVDYGLDLDGPVRADVQWVHDVVIIPAVDAPPGSDEAIDAITTASRPIGSVGEAYQDFVKVRNSVQGRVAWRGWGTSYYVSSENDYFAQMVTLDWNRDFLDQNLNLALGGAYGWDDIRPVREGVDAPVPSYRRTWHGNVVATQVLSPRTLLRVGAELNLVDGQQHDPYRNVYVDGGPVPERHPTRRSRRDVFVRLSRHLGAESSLRGDYRYYEDDWDVRSHTWGLRLNQRVSREVTVRYRYRYYTQLPAWFFRDDYRTGGDVDGYRTGDYRLGDYGSHLFGGEVLVRPRGLVRRLGFLETAELVVRYERYFNSNNFTADIIGTSLRVAF